MTGAVLVAYGSRYGSTREVAEAIAATLRERAASAEVRPASEVGDLDAYAAVVLGGGLYMGRWHADARRFLRRHRKELGGLPLAAFGMGPLTDRDEDRRGSLKQLVRALSRVPDVVPVAVEVFGGVIDPTKLRFPFRHVPAADVRDWDAIRRWAQTLPPLFARERAAA